MKSEEYMPATAEMIGELAKLLKMTGVDKETALNVSLMVRTQRNNRKMVAWMEANKEATVHEICKTAREINQGSDDAEEQNTCEEKIEL